MIPQRMLGRGVEIRFVHSSREVFTALERQIHGRRCGSYGRDACRPEKFSAVHY
jgi:hypothetical protein